jgi:dTDP-4-amino-4,6-dideoxygalactose transaminase
MCLSFQKRKHLGLGRGGMILLDDVDSYKKLIRMSYDGRDRNVLWAEQDIETLGYHYYMTPEMAQHGLEKFNQVKTMTPVVWSNLDYPDLSTLKVFSNVK